MNELLLIALGVIIASKLRETSGATPPPASQIQNAQYGGRTYTARALPEEYPTYPLDPWQSSGARIVGGQDAASYYAAQDLRNLYL